MLRNTWWLALPVLGLVILAVASSNNASPDPYVTESSRAIALAAFPHDPAAFCQGLVVDGDTLLEGTGQYGHSTLRRVELVSGKVLQSVKLPDQYFGEGITLLGDRVYQLTWKSKVCLVYDAKTLQQVGQLPYQWSGVYKEGWGLTNDGKNLIVSDGTSTIRTVDPETLREVRQVKIRDGRRYVERINELEYVDGEIWANIWYEDRVARIDPENGRVKGWIDCRNVYPARQRPDREHVLNGIACNAKTGQLFITGKNWPALYEIKVE